MANLFDKPRVLAIEGPIRVGKSTLSRLIADDLHAHLVTEPEGDSFLKAFYKDRRAAAFPTQMSFLYKRFKLLSELGRPEQTTVVDFLFEKDRIFANLNLGDDELRLYEQYYKLFRAQLPSPDLVIYLQASPEVLRKRLKKKNESAESGVTTRYIEEVARAYEYFFTHYTATDLLIVNTDEIDFVERSADLQQLLKKLREPIKGTQYYLPLISE